MSGKRKRVEVPGSDRVSNGNQPMTAIAAARKRAQDIAASESILERPPAPTHLQGGIVGSLHEDQTSDFAEESSEKDVPIARTFKLCNWRGHPENVLSDTGSELVVNLPKHSTIALFGCFDFNVIKGAININGANIGPSSPEGKQDQTYRAFMPITHPILKLRGLDDTNHVKFITCEAPVPLATINPFFDDMWHTRSSDGDRRSFSIMTGSDSLKLSYELCPESIPENWLRAVEACTASPSITLVAGAPGSGKSMFARRLVNRSLTGLGKTAQSVPVAFLLDIDPDDQEYMPVGQVSLVAIKDIKLGPKFVHPAIIPGLENSSRNELIRAHPVPRNWDLYMDFYYACVDDLFQTYNKLRSQHLVAPLVIKTSGRLHILNFDILGKFLSQIKPHNVVHLSSSLATDYEATTKSQTFRVDIAQCQGTYHEITAHEYTTNMIRSKDDLNLMQMQSYFHLISRKRESNKENGLAWTYKPLSTTVPWEFCYQETSNRKQDIAGFVMYTEPVEPASIVKILNGAIIHILTSNSSVVRDAYTKLPCNNKNRIPLFPKSEKYGDPGCLDPRTSEFRCIAMIRGFDLERNIVQVLVPNTHEGLLRSLIPEQTVFVYGCCDTPEWAFLEDKHAAMASTSARSSTLRGDKCTWVEEQMFADQMGYLNTLRRVRKFQT